MSSWPVIWPVFVPPAAEINPYSVEVEEEGPAAETEAKGAELESTVVEIDPDGDVLLEVSNQAGKRNLLVSSKVLTLASPVFATMLKSGFKEGFGDSSVSERTPIRLSDDNAEIFIVLCNAIHHRLAKLPNKLDVESLETLAITCDKYDCTSTLAPWSTMWLQAWYGDYSWNETGKLLSAAFVLDIPDAFSIFSYEILINHCGPYHIMELVGEIGLVTGNILEFAARKAEFDIALFDGVEKPAAELLWNTPCKTTYKRVGDYFKSLRDLHLWPVISAAGDQSILARFSSMQSVENPWATPCGDRSCSSCEDMSEPNFKDSLIHAKDKFLEHKQGLCLDCVKTGRASLQRGECRFPHKDIFRGYD